MALKTEKIGIVVAKFVATGAWSGLSPKAPGTVGSLSAALVWLYVQHYHPGTLAASPIFLIAVTILLGVIATHLCIKNEKESHAIDVDHPDPQHVVIDEWAGMFITLAAASPDNLTHVVWAFVLFRFFDITKPGFVRKLEKLPGAFGVMCDDIAAGLLAFLVFKAGMLFLS